MPLLSKIVNKFKRKWSLRNSKAYIDYLRAKGVKIGRGNSMRPKSTHIDITRPSLVTIGDNCYFNENFTLLTHDWVSLVFTNYNLPFLNSSGRVTIGNNVSFGQNVTVLKGVTIGDNCFIGAGSIVTKDIPSNSVAVGAPCRVIMSIEDYHKKRLAECEEEALDYARSISERYHRSPQITDFWQEFIWFVDGSDIDKYPELPIRAHLGSTFEKYKADHKAKYTGFEAFLKAAGIE